MGYAPAGVSALSTPRLHLLLYLTLELPITRTGAVLRDITRVGVNCSEYVSLFSHEKQDGHL